MTRSTLLFLGVLVGGCGGAAHVATSPSHVGAVRGDARAAIETLTEACDAGRAKACNNLGTAYARGAGVTRDDARAAQLFSRSCDSGDQSGCYNLGLALVAGHGVAVDEPRAAQLFDKACNEEVAYA